MYKIKMEFDPLYYDHLPIVYTKRLEEMTILKKDLNKYTSEDIFHTIYAESKPLYHKDLDNGNNLKPFGCKSEHKKIYLSKKLTFNELNLKVREINNKIIAVNTEPQEIMKTQIKTSDSKIQPLLSVCKPLKIVLIDVNKSLPKNNLQDNTEILSISDTEEEIIDTEETTMNNKEKTKTMQVDLVVNKTIIDIDEEGIELSPQNHIIKNINDFKNSLTRVDLRNCIIVIYNLFQKQFDAYQIDEEYSIIEYMKSKYSEVHKFDTKNCKSVFNILVCCWKNRQVYISLLADHMQYIRIARFIQTTHPCKNHCKCCCKDKVLHGNLVSVSKINNSFSSSKLIETAMTYKKNYKWIGYPAKTPIEKRSRTFRYKQCFRAFNLKSSDGQMENYELGRELIIYSKLVYKYTNTSSWIYKTLSIPSKQHYLSYDNSLDREMKISAMRNLTDMSLYTYRFMKELPAVSVNKKTKHSIIFDQKSSCKLRNTRSFMEPSNKKVQVLTILDKMYKFEKPVPNVHIRSKKVLIEPSTPTMYQSSVPPMVPKCVMEEEASQNINNLIKDILHHFRNVLLTINEDGKVAVALNAPINSLSSSELKILSQILSHAQEQVDKLGLRPGTCLNPETPFVINQTASNNSVPTATTYINTDNNMQEAKKPIDETKTRGNLLTIFSKMIGRKKHNYEASFRSYLGEKIDITPKITNVFSLNSPLYLSTKVPESPVVIINDDKISKSNKSIDTVNLSYATNNCELNQTNDIIMVDDDPEILSKPKTQDPRKRKGASKSNARREKIRILTPSENKKSTHDVSNVVTNDKISDDIEVISNYPNPSSSNVVQDPELLWVSESNSVLEELLSKPKRNRPRILKRNSITSKKKRKIEASTHAVVHIDPTKIRDDGGLTNNTSKTISPERSIEDTVDTSPIISSIEFVGV